MQMPQHLSMLKDCCSCRAEQYTVSLRATITPLTSIALMIEVSFIGHIITY